MPTPCARFHWPGEALSLRVPEALGDPDHRPPAPLALRAKYIWGAPPSGTSGAILSAAPPIFPTMEVIGAHSEP